MLTSYRQDESNIGVFIPTIPHPPFQDSERDSKLTLNESYVEKIDIKK